MSKVDLLTFPRDNSFHNSHGFASKYHFMGDDLRSKCGRVRILDEESGLRRDEIPKELRCRRRGCSVMWEDWTLESGNMPPRRTMLKSYTAWTAMRSRCFLKSNKHYKSYGGRGIGICERWNDFKNFFADMGERPKGMSLDRIDNDKGYSPENCRWANQSQQTRNNRRNRILTLNGKSQCGSDWSDELGIHRQTISSRLQRGWTDEEVLTTPVRKRSRL